MNTYLHCLQLHWRYHTSDSLIQLLPSSFFSWHEQQSARLIQSSIRLGVIYAHTTHPTSCTVAHSLLQSAIDKFVASIDESLKPEILWDLHYDQRHTPPTADNFDANIDCAKLANPHVLKLPDVDPGLALEDDVLKHVRAAWRRIMGGDEGFMVFGEREEMGEEAAEDGDGEM